jgi:alpha-tubulin suppressor-like RCC1 family protein
LEPVSVRGIERAIQITAGGRTTCALLFDHTVRCWGEDFYGQASGTGNSSDGVLIPVAVHGLANVVEVQTNGLSTCALMTNQTVRCWGMSGSGEVNQVAPIQPLTNVVRLARSVAAQHCVLLSGETVQCWSGSDGVPTAVDGLSGVTEIAGNCGRLANGSVRCWGPGGAGQIGNGSTDDRSSPAAVEGLGTAEQISAGGNHVCAVLLDQSLWCWGKDGFFDSIDYGSLPLPVTSLGGVRHVAAGDYNTCVVQADHVAKCWGDNTSGQLGDSTYPSTSSAIPISVRGLPVSKQSRW